MTVLTEKNIQLTIGNTIKTKKFDDSMVHGLSHCMKAVDFIVELVDCILFIEIKDPYDPNSTQEDRETFKKEFLGAQLDEDLKYKYRDSFLYEWACDNIKKPICYLLLVAIEELTKADLIHRTDELKRKLPWRGPKSGAWKQSIVKDCIVFNIATWNEKQPYSSSVKRI
jgi:hypothetical protein